MTTPLSSRWTPFYKFALPLLTLGGIGFGAWYSVAHPEQQHLPEGTPPQYAWVFVVITGLFVGGIFWWTIVPLKRVELDDDELVISDYRTEIRVSLANVASISGPSMTNPKRYTVTFEESTEFGRRITFLAPMAWTLMPMGDAEEVVELRTAWEAARHAGARQR